MAQILIVEDEDIIRHALKRLLEHNGYSVAETDSVDKALRDHNLDDFKLIISDLRLPGAPGTDLIRHANNTPVLIMTSYASVQSAVETMDMGAAYYIAKPFDHDDVLQKVAHFMSDEMDSATDSGPASGTKPETGVRGKPRLGRMLGNCKPVQAMYRRIEQVAPTNATTLICGETGTGKELVAKTIHDLSPRATKPLICVNCAAIPETLIESELFGYEKGAFTGANTNRTGLVEAADGGTLFLDEIGELPLEAQARLLRVLQEKEVRRIGAVTSSPVDIRLLCATHRDLRSMVERGDFREDLYYRINVINIEVPPLRQRGKDILEIAEATLARRSQELGRELPTFSPEAIQALSTYVWPGNIRELENAVERAAILCEGDEIDNQILGIDLQLVDIAQLHDRRKAARRPEGEPEPNSGLPEDDLSLEDYFQRFVLEHQDSMNETELAQKLGISRKCLWERRQRLGIPRKKSASGG